MLEDSIFLPSLSLLGFTFGCHPLAESYKSLDRVLAQSFLHFMSPFILGPLLRGSSMHDRTKLFALLFMMNAVNIKSVTAKRRQQQQEEKKKLASPGLEPETFSVLD
jgi:hypothetical protein